MGSGGAESQLHEPGDLGRRIAQRRRELGLTRAEVAARADMAEGYVEYMEEKPARVTSGALLRLAVALETTVTELSGANVELPPGRGGAAAHPTLQALDRDECRRLLVPGGVGRFVFNTDRGPVAVPVNFRALGPDLVFRTESGSSLEQAADGGPVSFEVDQIDDAMSSGWSVLATGRVQRIEDPDERRQVETLGVEPWAGGERSAYLRFEPSMISGRRISSTR
jgi:transcriptional regulator with XRE-family HTH domain